MRSLGIFSVFLLTLGLLGFMGSASILVAGESDPPHQTHLTADRGPGSMGCGHCHDGSPAYNNVYTSSCDTCHSPGGPYNGVNDPAVGALNNWENRSSPSEATQSLIYKTDGKLKLGKRKWCAACHDEGGAAAPEIILAVDDFEGYSSDSALQAVWKKLDDSKTVELATIEAPQGAESMHVDVWWENSSKTYGTVKKVDSATDVNAADSLGFYLRVESTSKFKKVKVRLNNGGVWSMAPVNFADYGIEAWQWKYVLVPREDFTNNGDWSAIKTIQLRPIENGGTNYHVSFWVDDIKFLKSDAPASSDPEPPNVVGDDVSYGVYVTGHSFGCTSCHDSAKAHIDGEQLSNLYDYFTTTTNPTGFRFYDDYGMQLPYDTYDPGPDGAFALCYKCHQEAVITQQADYPNLTTNFTDSNFIPIGSHDNLHLLHIAGSPYGCMSPVVYHGTCVLCHNVHGEANPANLRKDVGDLVYFDADGCEIAFGSDSDDDGTMDWYDADINMGGTQKEDQGSGSYPMCNAVCHTAAAPPSDPCVPFTGGLGMDGWYARDYEYVAHGGDPGATCMEADCHGNQSHLTHFDSDGKGPGISLDEAGCETCHAGDNYYIDDIVASGACDDCHSAGGAFDGLDDSVIGAWTNWADGVYESDGKTLKVGKENWCLGCHDDDPATTGTNESAIIDSVYAPCIAGDENNGDTYGYNITGHKIVCTNCHDAEKNHIDGEPRTYEVTEGSPPVAVNPYSDSYRLKDVDGQPAMNLPRLTASLNSQSFALCLDCHSATDLFSSGVSGTNFWNADTSPTNSHNIHLKINSNHFDSDWDGTADSRESCIACHNVHGSPSQAMIRHGEMISTPGTTDKVPALNFVYLIPSTGPTATATWAFSVPSGGTFDLYGWWTGGSNRASDAPYTISYGSFSQTIDVDQTIQTGAWNYIGTFTFAGATSGTVVLGDDANGYVIADAIGWDTNGDTTPDIIVDDLAAGFSTQGSGWLTSTSVNSYLNHEHYHAKQVPPSDPNATLAQSVGGFMNYGSSTIASNGVCKACHNGITYVRTPNLSPKVLNAEAAPDTVPNDGSGSTLITASVYDPDGDFDDTLPSKIEVDLSVIGGSSNQAMNDNGNNGDQSIGDGIYSYEATVPASTPDIPKSLVITATDDASNSGQGTAVLTVVTPGAIYVDDLDPEFSTQGTGWLTSGSANSYKNSEHYHAGSGGGATAKATWTFSIPEAGDYELYGWWTGGSNRASDAPYTIYYSGGPTTIDVNQKIQTGDWNYIGGPFTFTASPSSGSVEVSDDANGYVITDAIKWDPYP
ncbi:MAG: hypothetical protein SWH78_01500 [Thermodesulfobacteriota bacterium]|nr:hypothetical protein [Thermodesulfobacteriota bacterium]